MTFLNDLWKKFKESHNEHGPREKESESDTLVLEKPPESARLHPESLSHSLKRAESVLNAFQQNEENYLETKTVLNNLNELKQLVNEPKEEKPELRFSQIKQRLGPAECHETVRQERWSVEIYCPKCQSAHLKRLPQSPTQSPHNHRYRCLDCGTEFNDDTGTPMERGIPPLNIWMQCWYLMGCTESLGYIASQLGLDMGVVEIMVRQLQKTFNAQQPLTRFLGYAEWSKQSQHLRTQLKDDLLREYERLNANIATVPKDTAEYRRQLNLRRELTPTTAPPSPKGRKR